MDGSQRVFALEYIASAYQNVDSGFYESWSRFCLYATVYLYGTGFRRTGRRTSDFISMTTGLKTKDYRKQMPKAIMIM